MIFSKMQDLASFSTNEVTFAGQRWNRSSFAGRSAVELMILAKRNFFCIIKATHTCVLVYSRNVQGKSLKLLRTKRVGTEKVERYFNSFRSSREANSKDKLGYSNASGVSVTCFSMHDTIDGRVSCLSRFSLLVSINFPGVSRETFLLAEGRTPGTHTV